VGVRNDDSINVAWPSASGLQVLEKLACIWGEINISQAGIHQHLMFAGLDYQAWQGADPLIPLIKLDIVFKQSQSKVI
jgi:hypothetical protein